MLVGEAWLSEVVILLAPSPHHRQKQPSELSETNAFLDSPLESDAILTNYQSDPRRHHRRHHRRPH